MPKATTVETARRVNTIVQLILKGATPQQIHEQITEKLKWGIKTRRIDSLIKKAWEKIQSDSDGERARNVALTVARLNAVITEAWQFKDFKTIIAAVRELNRVQGNYADLTIRLGGADHALLNELLSQLDYHQIKPSDVFNAMLATIHKAKQEQLDDGR